MRVLDSQSRLTDQLACIGDFERAAASDKFSKVNAVHQLHHQIMDSVYRSSIRRCDHRRVRHLADDLHLPGESGNRIGALHFSFWKNLDRDFLFQSHVPSAKYASHSPAGKRLHNFIVANSSVVAGAICYRLAVSHPGIDDLLRRGGRSIVVRIFFVNRRRRISRATSQEIH